MIAKTKKMVKWRSSNICFSRRKVKINKRIWAPRQKVLTTKALTKNQEITQSVRKLRSNSGAPAPTTGGWNSLRTISVRTYIIRTLFVALSVSLVADFFSSSFISDESTGVEEKGLVSDFQMFDLKDGERVPRIRPH